MTDVTDPFCGIFGVTPGLKKAPDEGFSPFVAYDDGYQYPSLFTEVNEMIETSTLIYPLAELRSLARDGKVLFGRETITSVPFTHSQIVQVVDSNRKELEELKAQIKKDFYYNILQSMDERNMISACRSDNAESQTHNLTPATVIAFDDEFQDKELVYMIDVNHLRKRVTVCFRGSVTELDWATNYEVYMQRIDNPLKRHSSQEDSVHVHHGFYNYLFTPNSRNVKDSDGKNISEYEEILQHVLPVLREYAGYKLYVTGHSLGGALATLFAFEAAALPDKTVPKPVSLVTIGAPYVGDIAFRDAHQLLESLGKLRHLRVSNNNDWITMIPKFAFKWNIFDSKANVGSLFKHAGMHLRLYNNRGQFEVNFPRVRAGLFEGIYDEFARGWDQTIFSAFPWNVSSLWKVPGHDLREYSRRLEENRHSLDSVYLNSLYSREDIVGKLVVHI